MWTSRGLGWLKGFGAAALAFTTSTCVDEKIVYRDTNVPTPPAAAANFVGYGDADQQRTVCGNCHISHQTRWKATAHAEAWFTLQQSGQAQGVCQSCHTVNDRGNAVTDTAAGFRSTRDRRYHDVQCESCHGPGLSHVTNPVSTNRPLASVHVDTALRSGCGECHTGAHHPFVEEWRSSRHGRPQAGAVGRAECIGCHTAQGVLAAWNVNTEYTERTSTTPVAITCAVCHDPHNASNPKQLRFRIDVPSEEQNLCMKCHHKRGVPDPTTFRGPHSPEGPLLLGYGGWWPPNLQVPGGDTLIATHGSGRNPRLCATCHVDRFTVTDSLTRQFVFQVTGHKFRAIPCVNAQGIPTTQTDCALTQRTFRGCTGSGCHGSEAVARSALITAEQRITRLLEELRPLLGRIGCSEFVNDNRYTTGEGARFNYLLGAAVGTSSDPGTPACAPSPSNNPRAVPPAVANGGAVTHNPFLIEALLTASIRQVRQDYGLTAITSVSLENELRDR